MLWLDASSSVTAEQVSAAWWQMLRKVKDKDEEEMVERGGIYMLQFLKKEKAQKCNKTEGAKAGTTRSYFRISTSSDCCEPNIFRRHNWIRFPSPAKRLDAVPHVYVQL